MALGQVDFGLYSVVGGMIAFLKLIDNLLSTAISRFYGVSVGMALREPENGIEECRKWFTTAVIVQTVLPVILVVVGYPIGEWVVREFLTIPPDRVEACVWVWRYVCLSCFVVMFSMPFRAMYTAKQEIAELTIYSFATTTLTAFFLYYIVTHPGVWLATYAFWMCMMSVIPQVIICINAVVRYRECRFRFAYVNCWSRIRQLTAYAGWQSFGCLGGILRAQGLAILVNKYFGPTVNAAVSIGSGVSSHCNTLATCLVGAFSPAIMNAYGAGRMDEMRRFAYWTCKIGTLLMLVFSIPLALEIDEVLLLWLKNPPRYAAGLSLCVLAMMVIDRTAVGHMLAVNARGKIALYQAVLGGSLICTLPIAWILIVSGVGVYAIGWAMIVTMMACAWGRVWFARRLVGMSARYWLRFILLPLCALTAVSLGVGCLPRLFLAPSFVRVCMTTCVVEICLLPSAWYLILSPAERASVLEKVRRKIGK